MLIAFDNVSVRILQITECTRKTDTKNYTLARFNHWISLPMSDRVSRTVNSNTIKRCRCVSNTPNNTLVANILAPILLETVWCACKNRYKKKKPSGWQPASNFFDQTKNKVCDQDLHLANKIIQFFLQTRSLTQCFNSNAAWSMIHETQDEGHHSYMSFEGYGSSSKRALDC